ncbi:hypothetical protein NC796_13145 [Aliifodinibius sp. S!AR15-10]|uniref:hypothetical protein n=1 Tax=Aliifodinibius sp. S!AR15-10 TaxID=2950437 RepID=UPI002859B9BC|nr:hypothetical protein [Aliifodinibius sp. S!AR15-10]MDR8392093.1 hypothetical protein [Aliifodinibius sp. S!AR15-10]
MKRTLLVVFLINAILVSTHKGEFWPFSIFPMFSQAGNPWSRGLVIEVDDMNRKDLWETKSLSSIDDRVVALREHGIDDIDYANFISKTKNWDEERIQALRNLFQIEQQGDAKWLASRVTGHLTEQDSVVVKVIPMFLVTSDTTYKNPDLFK